MFSLDNIAKIAGCIAGFATAVAFIVAWRTLKHTKEVWDLQLKHDRPFITLEKGSKISKLPSPTEYQMNVLLKNGGARPAHNPSIVTYFLEKDCSGYKAQSGMDVTSQERSVDVIWPGETINLSRDIVLEPSMPKRYVVLVLEYKDQVTDDDFAQRIYLKYPRIVETEKGFMVDLDEILIVASLEERREIDDFIQTLGSKYIQSPES